MQRIITGDELFDPGEPSTNTKGTMVTANWLNAIQEEVANTIEGFGETLDPGQDDQLFSVLASYLQRKSFIDGLVLSNSADADHDISIGVGVASDSTGAALIKLTSQITKQIDAAWVEGDDLGGLFDGSVAADTTYHVFLIKKDSDGSIDAGFDTSLSAANIPDGYAAFRRVGSVLTDSSSNIINFDAYEIVGGSVRYDYKEYIADISSGGPAITKTVFQVSVPEDVEMIANIIIHLLESTSGTSYGWVNPTTFIDVAPGLTTSDIRVNASIAETGQIAKSITTDVSAQMAYRISQTTAGLRILTIGYADRRVN